MPQSGYLRETSRVSCYSYLEINLVIGVGTGERALFDFNQTRAAFDEVLAMLSGKYPSDIAAELEARITWDRVNDRLIGSRAARMTAVISGGTIPNRGLYTVNLPDRTRLGELDEVVH